MNTNLSLKTNSEFKVSNRLDTNSSKLKTQSSIDSSHTKQHQQQQVTPINNSKQETPELKKEEVKKDTQSIPKLESELQQTLSKLKKVK